MKTLRRVLPEMKVEEENAYTGIPGEASGYK